MTSAWNINNISHKDNPREYRRAYYEYRRATNPKFSEEANRRSVKQREKYATDADYKKRFKAQRVVYAKRRYAEDSEFRERVKTYSRQRLKSKMADPVFRRHKLDLNKASYYRNIENRSWNKYVGGARKRGYCWEITKEQHTKLITSDCSYCGAKPSPINGIDRVNNEIGYMPDNVVAACTICNKAKYTLTRDVFIAWALRLAAHQREIG